MDISAIFVRCLRAGLDVISFPGLLLVVFIMAVFLDCKGRFINLLNTEQSFTKYKNFLNNPYFAKFLLMFITTTYTKEDLSNNVPIKTSLTRS
jgi:hypothetical protein